VPTSPCPSKIPTAVESPAAASEQITIIIDAVAIRQQANVRMFQNLLRHPLLARSVETVAA
jgi:hypothetical protein